MSASADVDGAGPATDPARGIHSAPGPGAVRGAAASVVGIGSTRGAGPTERGAGPSARGAGRSVRRAGPSARAQGSGARPRVVVVGAGVAGLTAAMALARRGAGVDVLERDRSAAPFGRRAAATWLRDGVPQVAHAHVFGPGCHRVLSTELPGVLSLLLAAGARELAVGGPDPALAMRRPLFDWVLRRVAEREPGVRVHGGTPATGLCVEGGRVVGVEVPGGALETASVVDATGARGMLAGVGPGVPGRRPSGPGVADRESPGPGSGAPVRRRAGTAYFSRCYVLRWPGDPGELNLGAAAGGAFDGCTCRAVPGDNGTVTVTFGVPVASLAGLPALRVPDVFQAAAERVPVVADWVDPGSADPLTGVTVLDGWPPDGPLAAPRATGDDLIEWSDDDREDPAWPEGLIAVGDARQPWEDAESGSGVLRALTDGLDCAVRLPTGLGGGAAERGAATGGSAGGSGAALAIGR